MMRTMHLLAMALAAWLLCFTVPGIAQQVEWPGRERADTLAAETLDTPFESLKPLFTRLSAPRPGSWRDLYRDPGQSVADYRLRALVRPGVEFSVLHLQPLGEPTVSHQQLQSAVGEFIKRFFQIPVRLLPVVPVADLPANARRFHPQHGERQLLTTYVATELLQPRRAEKAIAIVGLANIDLWPGKEFGDYVVAHTVRQQRVSVISTYRFGVPTAEPEAFRQVLLPTLRLAAHEVAHILDMEHCIAYTCMMNGATSQEDVASRPLYLCPSCLNKLCWNTQSDPARRYAELIAYCREYGLTEQAEAYARCRARLVP